VQPAIRVTSAGTFSNSSQIISADIPDKTTWICAWCFAQQRAK